jgi:hypothetical protein
MSKTSLPALPSAVGMVLKNCVNYCQHYFGRRRGTIKSVDAWEPLMQIVHIRILLAAPTPQLLALLHELCQD